MERGTVRLCGLRHISTSGLGVGASPASFIAVFCNLLHQISRLLTVIVSFDVKRRSATLFPPKPEVVFNGQTVAQIGPYIVLTSNRKSGSANSFMWFAPYFYLRFGHIGLSFIAVFGRPLQVTVRPMLRDHSPVCPVCKVGILWPNGRWIRMPLGVEVGLGSGEIVLHRDSAYPMERGTAAPPLCGSCLLWPNVAHRSNC